MRLSMLLNSDKVFAAFIRISAIRRVNSVLRGVFHGWAAPRGFPKIFLCIVVFLGAAIINSNVFSTSLRLVLFELDKDRKAPVDYGFGPGAGIRPPLRGSGADNAPAMTGTSEFWLATPRIVPPGGGPGGLFGPPFPWPIIPIHVALLPDGRVLSYGTDQTGAQGAQLIYDVWNPNLGNGSSAHTILPNTVSTDIFCGAASLLGSGFLQGSNGDGNVLLIGGDLTVGGARNFSNNKVNLFAPPYNAVVALGPMNYPRWYPSIITLRNGDKLVIGGRSSPTDTGTAPPEVGSWTSGWRTLPGISIMSNTFEWFYPRGFVGFDGAVIALANSGGIFRITTDGAGTLQYVGTLNTLGNYYYPTVMFSPFKVLTVRNGRMAKVVDISTSPPVVTNVPNLNYDRIWGNTTLLPDGRILASGGSGVNNEFTNVAYQTEIYNPASGTWTLGASAAIPRLYHSSALLLPDGSVLTGGGGAPGPVNELNAEIYYPSYLYDGSGNPAPRPQIVYAPPTLQLNHNFSVTVGASDTVGKINLVRVGSNTHSFNPEERLIPVPFSQSGTTITATLNLSPELAPPGYYMLFVFNSSGVPAVAKIVSIVQAVP